MYFTTQKKRGIKKKREGKNWPKQWWWKKKENPNQVLLGPTLLKRVTSITQLPIYPNNTHHTQTNTCAFSHRQDQTIISFKKSGRVYGINKLFFYMIWEEEWSRQSISSHHSVTHKDYIFESLVSTKSLIKATILTKIFDNLHYTWKMILFTTVHVCTSVKMQTLVRTVYCLFPYVSHFRILIVYHN